MSHGWRTTGDQPARVWLIDAGLAALALLCVGAVRYVARRAWHT